MVKKGWPFSSSSSGLDVGGALHDRPAHADGRGRSGGLSRTCKNSKVSSLQHNILCSFSLVLVFWNLLTRLSIYSPYVIVVEKGFSLSG